MDIITRKVKCIITKICDLCTEKGESTVEATTYRCRLCGRDGCAHHTVHTDDDYLIPGEFIGDYPDHYCVTCWEIGKDEREKILELRKQQELEEISLFIQWRDKSAHK